MDSAGPDTAVSRKRGMAMLMVVVLGVFGLVTGSTLREALLVGGTCAIIWTAWELKKMGLHARDLDE